MAKSRLDQYLLQNNLCSSREKAKNIIIAGCVTVNGQIVVKPSCIVRENDTVVVEDTQKFVSRGGEKLKKALDYFSIDVTNAIALDLGSSTGGFVDCLLQFGAKKVYAVDVGYGQLDYSLRKNPKVIVMERRNARYLKKEDFVEKIDFITADLSFISIVKVLQSITSIFDYSIPCVLLIKPQFEAEKYQHKKGVVKNPQYHKEILNRIIYELLRLDIIINGITFSPIKGPKGNIEFLLYCTIHKIISNILYTEIDLIINTCVDEAHLYFA